MMKFSDFGFKENPFAITPDPRYLYLSRGHEESLAHLIYGTGPNGGFVLLSGEVGTGKTMLIRSLLAQHLSEVDIALVLNPRLSRREFIATICDELGVQYPGPPYSLKLLIDKLTKHLLKTHAEGRHTVLVVDEAQNLSPRVLETVRLLTNLETTRHKLLRIILVGQPELLQMLSKKELRQVDQRITARYHLSPLERQETASYITHRLEVAGIREDLFTPAATWLIHRLSGGVPRRINTLCERTLLAIFSHGRQRASALLVLQAAKEVRGKRRRSSVWRWSLLALLLVTLGVVGYLQWPVSAPETVEREEMVGAESDRPSEAATDTELPPRVITEEPETMVEIEAVDGVDAGEAPPAVPLSDGVESSVEGGDTTQVRRIDPSQLFLRSQSWDQVYQPLFALWGVSYQQESTLTPCMQAPMKGLRCLKGRGDWQRLESLNRPLLLRLVKEKQYRLLLVKLKQDALLVVDDGEGEGLLEADLIEPYWDGEYVLLWRPHGGVALIGEGSAGEVVTWLRQRLRQFDHQSTSPAVGTPDHFNTSLKQRLQAFQRTKGLLDDGVAGQQTLIHLNNLAPAPGTPTLLAETGEG
jgi:general secretion pathway protein A